MPHFIVSTHGTLNLIEPLTGLGRKLLAELGLATDKVALRWSDYREFRFCAREAGLLIQEVRS